MYVRYKSYVYKKFFFSDCVCKWTIRADNSPKF
jgi:hypothetical protein